MYSSSDWNEKPQLYALFEMNTSERNKVKIKKCTDFVAYYAAKDIYLYF